MGKTANAIRMLNILGSGRCVSADELARILQTHKRNIYAYYYELRMAGYKIKSKRGPNGGYILDKDNRFPPLSLTDEETKALYAARDYLMSSNTFLNQDDFLSAFGKISFSVQNKQPDEVQFSQEDSVDMMPKEEIKKRYNFLNECYENKEEIEMVYNFVKIGTKTIKMQIYRIYPKNGSWYFSGFEPDEGEAYNHLKLARIEKYHKTGNHYTEWKGYENIEKSVDRKLGKTPTEVTFIAKGYLVRLLKERRIGEGHTILEELEDGSIKVKATFRDEESLLHYLSGCREQVVVIEPKQIVDKLLSYANYLKETYK